MDPAVAARLATSPSATSARSHSSSSPSTSRLAHSGSVTGLNGEDTIMSTATTIEQVLAAHAFASDPVRAALETVLLERNSLSAQNSQLWNHLKKQRNNYQLAASDVKRIRAERDGLRARLAEYENTTSNEPSDNKRARPLTTTIHAATSGATDMSMESDVRSKSGQAPHSRSTPRPKPSRHQSDDRSGPTRVRSSSRDQHMQSTSPLVISRDYAKGQQRERSNTHPEFTTPTSTGSEGPASPSSAADSSVAPERDAIDIASRGIQRGASPTPLLIPTRAESLPSGSSSDTSLRHQVLVNGDVKEIDDPLGTAKPTTSKLFIPSINPPTSPPSTQLGNEPTEPHPTFENSKTGGATSPPSVNLTPNYLTSAPARMASRESRISLPDEARRYYANLADSPLSSPHAPSSVDTWNQAKRQANGESGLSQVPEEGDGRGDESASPRPFLELDTTDDSESDHRTSRDTRTNETYPEMGAEGGEQVAYEMKNPPNYVDSLGHAVDHLSMAHLTNTTADQFPLPPVTYNSQQPQSPTRVHSADGFGGSSDEMTGTLLSSGALITSSSTLAPDVTVRRSRDRVDSFIMPTNQPAATFRQMPLLDSDLKTSTLEVLGNHIRANDKGKEVLSFVIAVHVVGKDSWQIEKFYSDVLALDSRLRTRCSRSTLKKLEPLPDNKLFKDHAPAKVDQRKNMLQAYLQSVMRLPIKDKNEIIVFFSSDVMRERSPVTKSGYKEGYLTKRGKNFGGWKTRYFVLQGPVLEYYESRGGAHLGSIQIIGAQIGRQQRAGNKGDLDDENEFRHAFLIIEQKRGPAGQNIRHVLCAESDKERDAWVEVLVRYVLGSYNEDERAVMTPTNAAQNPLVNTVLQPRASTSSLTHSDSPHVSSRRLLLKDQIQKSNTQAIPITSLSVDSSTGKFLRSIDPASPTKSPVDKGSVSSLPIAGGSGKSSLDRASAEDVPQPSSLPISSTLSEATPTLASIGERSASELGHYPDLQPIRKPDISRPTERTRASYFPTVGVPAGPPTERPPSPEKALSLKDDSTRIGKISGPMNGVPIPPGYKFGGKDPVPDQQPSNERERKARSRAFWRWPSAADKAASAPTLQSRAVFGVPLEESLAVSQIANLPSIVFRSIQYLEAKKADQEEGIYRLSGSSAVIKNLKDRFNAEGDVDLLSSDVQDPHAIAGLLKTFLRELPSSLLTRELHMRFLAVMDFVDTQERIRELQELVSQLPLANYSLLRALTAHLILIVQNSNVNKMTMRNVGIVFSPTLGIPAGVFSLMLGEFNRVFNVNGEGSDSSVEEDDTTTAPAAGRLSGGLSRRNSKRYSDAAADELLGLSGRALPTTSEDHSDDGDDLSVPDQDESDAETTEADAENSVPATSPGLQYKEQVHPPADESDEPPNRSRASVVAAKRGLNLNLGPSTTKADRRRSRVPQGLPASPRPSGNSPRHTPTFGPQTDASGPLQEPSV